MTEKELRLWLAREDAEDIWQVAVDEEVLPGEHSLSEALLVERPSPDSTIEVLHLSQKKTKDPPWVELDPASILSDDKRAKLRKHKGRWKRKHRGTAVQIVVVLLIVFGLLFLIDRNDADQVTDEPSATEADPMETIFAQLEEQKLQRGPQPEVTESGEPTLSGKIVVARSDRLVFVANMSDQTWDSCEVILNGKDGHRYLWQGPIHPRQTLHQPLRSFRRNGEPFEQHESELENVLVRVPGYAEWHDRF